MADMNDDDNYFFEDMSPESPVTVGPHLSEPSVQLTALLEYFDSKCMFY